MSKSYEGFEVKLVNEISESIKNSGAAIGEALRSIYVNSLVEYITSSDDKETTKERLREYIVKNEKEKRELKKSIIKDLEDTLSKIKP